MTDTTFNSIFNQLFSIIFIIEILLKLNTGIYSNGVLEIRKPIIMKFYFKNQFFFDLISLIPLILNNFVEMHEYKLLFLLRIKKISDLIWKLDEFLHLEYKLQSIVNLIKLTIFMLIFAHIFGCFFHYIAVLEIKNEYSNSWIQKKGYENNIWFENYIESLYFSVVTMITVGYGDIVPITTPEKVFCTILMLLSGIIYGYVINSIGQILMEYSTNEAELKYDLNILTI